MQIPKMKKIAIDIIGFAIPTAANAFFPINLPTIIASVMLPVKDTGGLQIVRD